MVLQNVTMAQIASEAGMSKKTLYAYFADKRALLNSLVEFFLYLARRSFFGFSVECCRYVKTTHENDS